MPVIIEIQNLQTTIPLNCDKLNKIIQKVLKVQRITRGHLTFVFVNDTKIRALNKKYLRHDYATDVLTFDWSEKKRPSTLDGEIVISTQTAKRNAADYDESVESEILLYMIHGILHLCGFDDHSPADIKKMRLKEDQLMGLLRLTASPGRAQHSFGRCVLSRNDGHG